MRQQIEARYGELNDCEALSGTNQAGVWVLDTDESGTGAGSIGIHVCAGSCATDLPDAIEDWTFYQPTTAAGAYERVEGLNDDGSVVFAGGAGELAYDTSTGTFSPEIGHG